MHYEVQVVVPGFERTTQKVDVRPANEVSLTIELKPQTRADRSYPPVSADPEVNYVFGAYAWRSGNWPMARSYCTQTLLLLPDHVPAIVCMGEALLNEEQPVEAKVYLERAAKLDPSYWRTEEVLAKFALQTGATDEAVQHARRALELSQMDGRASNVSPLLAAALLAQATQILQSYVKEHPEDVASKKQLEALNRSHEPSPAKHANAGGTSEGALSSTAKKDPPADYDWLPKNVDESVPPVEAGSPCNLDQVMQQAGQRIQEFVANVQRFTATESLLHESVNRAGKVLERKNAKYDYTVSIEELRPGILGVDEYLSNGPAPVDSLGGVSSKGLPALVLIFHPYHAGDFSMTCEGLATWKGARAWQVYFRQREDRPNRIRAYRIGWQSAPHPVPLKGRAWFLADSYQIIGLQTDLAAPLPDIRLTMDHTSIEYGPVHFASRGLDMWVPQTAEVYCDLKGKLLHQRMNFTKYLLFSVDDKQQISTPKTTP
jgi:tetratricopeptide (TPR) repeat protein